MLEMASRIHSDNAGVKASQALDAPRFMGFASAGAICAWELQVRLVPLSERDTATALPGISADTRANAPFSCSQNFVFFCRSFAHRPRFQDAGGLWLGVLENSIF